MMTENHDIPDRDTWDTIIIGGGQSGLAAGYYLSGLNEDFLILDEHEETGKSWSSRWDSLRLFTPAWTNGLPGLPFPGPAGAFPTKNEVADYLKHYKEKFNLPVLYAALVTRLVKKAAGYEIIIKGRTFFANSVIVATGSYSIPKTPSFAKKLNPYINQFHSSTYKSPADLAEGDVLVVGAGTSGLQIAMDLLKNNRQVFVAGKPPVRIPDFIFKYFAKQFVWFATNVLNTGTPMGRKAQHAIKSKGGAAPLINISLEEVKNAGGKHVERVIGANNGWPVLEAGDEFRIANIVWCTGFSPDYSWLNLPGAIDENGYPVAARGVSDVFKGLYFVGSMFQYGLTSTWLGGVGRDAEFVSKLVHDYNKRKIEVMA